ncbi:aminodeoxychorismate synthase component I [Portibacter marinus]|uniref:aminodeoxychorismate synthase component I n=1 Tax=Portibacter marinus TaxID=2898660 RepID=UPI001F273A35|nr:aminodeoxychorismate synthase component I [Portibacter marinus]
MNGFEKMNFLGGQKTPFFFMVDFELENILVLEKNEWEDVFFDVNGIKNHNIKYGSQRINIQKGRTPFKEYKEAFDLVHRELHYGNSFLLNLTKATEIKIEHTLFDVFLNSKAKYKLFYKDEFVCFSPEPFIRIKNNIISSYPMKGTANANVPNAALKLIANEKELSEHYTIVDLIRNDLSIVSENVMVKKFRYLETVESEKQKLYQLSSEISGDLPEDWTTRVGDMFENILPAGSISGAPKKKTVEIIKRAEKEKRGFYTGIMGYFDGQSLDSGVMIRFIERRGEQYYYRSGGGITFMSELNSEYSELIDKIYVPVFRNN